MTIEEMTTALNQGDTALGIELGSTRIKAVLLGPDQQPIAQGSSSWENQYKQGLWTYDLTDAWSGLQQAYAKLRQNVREQYGVSLRKIGALGISAMMHGYLPFDSAGRLLMPFRTWRNTNTGPAAAALSELFDFNIPLRWSIAHLEQAMLNQEEHVARLASINTLAGYIHWQLSGRRVLGVGDASGVFPIDAESGDYDRRMLAAFRAHIKDRGYSWDILQLLPQVLPAGADAGSLTSEGAALIDPSGELEPGVLMAPPEGDAGTGMVATDSVAPRTGNVSAGTSIFAMVVLEKPLSRPYPEIDMVTTPDGLPVAMVHCNNCTSDLNAWADIFAQVGDLMGMKLDYDQLFPKLYRKSLEGEPDAGGLMVCNFLSGEPVVGLAEGRPLVVRRPDSQFNLANFMRAQLYSALASLVLGMETLQRESVQIDRLTGHGGLFKTPGVGQRYLAAATGSPVVTLKTAGEGGAYGMALLAAFRRSPLRQSLAEFLTRDVFAGQEEQPLQPDPTDQEGFAAFLQRYKAALPVEQVAVDCL
ncbi:ATPase [Oscillospiraceae bacterium HV4-5-C5C]|nr:ATPase [Oscillospiraceae bacterium HV4-5-C5C]